MKKIFAIVLSALLTLGITACSSNTDNSQVTGTYNIHVSGYDYGCGVDMATLTLDKKVSNVDKTDFKVEETKQNTDWTDENYPVIVETTERKIIDAYTVDENGNKIDGPSQYVTIEMNCDPNEGSPLLYTVATNYNTWSNPYYLTFSLTDECDIQVDKTDVETFDIEKEYEEMITDADVFELDTFTASDDVSLNYGLYQPTEQTDTLFVWLHGTGEAGIENTDPHVTALANKVTALAGEEFQGIVGATSVLVPQCPTIWQDHDGKGQKWENGLPKIEGDSYYLTSLSELIDSVKESVGAKNVVIGGCSGGGYMTMAMIIAHPDYFSVAIPICEAYPDEDISDEEIEDIKDIPMYFIYSEDDPSVDPSVFEEVTISRLKDAGASNLHVCSPEHVVDTSNTYNILNNGEQYQYNGHWSWIYFYNNEADCDDGDASVFEWIAEQVN